jgi:hypothetical protein
VNGGLGLRRRTTDHTLTRGGPAMTGPAGGSVNAGFGSDSRRVLSISTNGQYAWNEFGGWGASGSLSFNVKPSSALTVSAGPNFSRSHALAQYVRTVEDDTALATFGGRYVFSDLDQTQLSLPVRVNWILSPKMSLQMYAQPLLAVGDYWNFKELALPRTFTFNRYGPGVLSYDASNRRYTVDPDGTGSTFAFRDPDFNFKSLRMNSVFRWEWRPGSTLFLVWTQSREDFERPGVFELGRDAGSLFRAPADDVFMVKLAYWFSR